MIPAPWLLYIRILFLIAAAVVVAVEWRRAKRKP